MVDSMRYKDWFEKANRYLKSAKILLENDCGNDIVAFHCQHSIEKYFKGFLIRETGETIEGHSLLYLCKKAAEINNIFKNEIKNCAFVNQYYIETRYPADNPLIVTDEEANECIRIAEFISNNIIK